ncbi:polysaccharide pyruvyl transferase family protein [Oceanimonas smirnovii]|uniref:Polysaccharide pyruvyl transferase family protein n=1 Tax=Oceanimonas smirnovii TaxID=264574 RepID=A0ABW7P453_9GAMM
MKKMAFIGNPSSLKYFAKDNTGNIVHGYAARYFFDNHETVKQETTRSNIEYIRSNFHGLGFVTATMLNVNRTPSFLESHKRTAEFIKKLDMPICVFGLGSQANKDQKISESNVNPITVELLRTISDHSNKIAVRGEFTAELCNKYGVKNVEIVGCQSAFVAGIKNYNNKDNLKKIQTMKSIGNLTANRQEQHLFKLMHSNCVDIIGQTDTTEEKISLNEVTISQFNKDREKYWLPMYVEKLVQNGYISRDNYFEYQKNHFRKYYNVNQWIDKLQDDYQFCFGTRFHGNMIALWAGVPALWISHDMRTQELCEHLGLPFYPHEKLKEINNIEQLAQHCNYDLFWNRLPGNLKKFINYLKDNNIYELVSPDVKKRINKIS